MRDDHEDKKVFRVKKELLVLHHHALFRDPLKHKEHDGENRLTARQHEEVAEEFSQKIFGTGYGLGKNERVDADAKISDRRIGHHERDRKSTRLNSSH